MSPDPAIAARITNALAEFLSRDASSIQPTSALRDDLGLDSMALIELIFRIEEAFDLQIPDKDMVGLVTVANVIEYVENHLGEAPGAPA